MSCTNALNRKGKKRRGRELLKIHLDRIKVWSMKLVSLLASFLFFSSPLLLFFSSYSHSSLSSFFPTPFGGEVRGISLYVISDNLFPLSVPLKSCAQEERSMSTGQQESFIKKHHFSQRKPNVTKLCVIWIQRQDQNEIRLMVLIVKV